MINASKQSLISKNNYESSCQVYSFEGKNNNNKLNDTNS